MDSPYEIRIGPLIFTKEESSGMTVNSEFEVLGYCEGIWPEMWDEFIFAAENRDIKISS